MFRIPPALRLCAGSLLAAGLLAGPALSQESPALSPEADTAMWCATAYTMTAAQIASEDGDEAAAEFRANSAVMADEAMRLLADMDLTTGQVLSISFDYVAEVSAQFEASEWRFGPDDCEAALP